MIPSSAITDPGLRLVHELYAAYCTTDTDALITSLRDQITAHLTADPDAIEDLVLCPLGVAAGKMRERAAQEGLNATRWAVPIPAGQQRHNASAYATAGQALADVLNNQDPRPLLLGWVDLASPRAAVDLVCEAVWLARTVLTGRYRTQLGPR